MPLIALIDGKRQTADREGPRVGSCPGCRAEMIAKLGDIVSWHWAHRPIRDGEPIDRCSYGETEWHLAQKSLCDDPTRIEVTKGQHRADVLTTYGWAVEFQHSTIPVEKALAREDDWGRRLLWVADGIDAYRNGSLQFWKPEHMQDRAYWTIQWSRAPQWVRSVKARIFIDVGDGWYLMIGRWQQTGPLKGYGWHISSDAFARDVVNGPRPPKNPSLGEPVNTAKWSRLARRTRTTDQSQPQAGGSTALCARPPLVEQGPCKVCGKVVLSSSKWPDVHPACHQWPEQYRKGRVDA